MTSDVTPSEKGRATDGSIEERLKTKSKIAEKLFENWKHGPKQDADAIKLLTYSPGLGDMLTAQKSKNADIFTTSRWAAKRAHEFFAAFMANQALFDSLQLPPRKVQDMEDLISGVDSDIDVFDKFEIVIVGSSVAGLVFHGTLIYLFGKWQQSKKQKYGLDDYFSFRFLDSHKRPLQRLRQARDRRIIPRFEYERILDVDKDDLTPDLYKRPALPNKREADNISLTASEEAFLVAWNEHRTIQDAGAIAQNKKDLGVGLLPEELCWEAGTVRHVANQIHDGYLELTRTHDLNWTFDTFDGVEPGQSTTGGHIFRKAEAPEGGFEKDKTKRRVGLWTTTNQNKDEPTLKCDFVLLATGPGIDVSPSGPAPGSIPDARRLHENTQASYWNTPKIELDVVETDEHNVLVLGHSDSAAGSIYSNIFDDPEACSFRFLTTLLSSSDAHRKWFRNLKAAVSSYWKAKAKIPPITSMWQEALEDRTVQGALFDFPKEPNAKSDLRPDTLKQLLRSYVTVSLSYRAKEADPKKGVKEFKIQYEKYLTKPPVFLDCAQAGHLWHKSPLMQDRLFADAWPENRIIMALLSPHILVYQENASKDENLIVAAEVGDMKRPVKREGILYDQFRYSVPLYRVEVSYPLADRKTYNPVEKTFKYVLDCRGRFYTSQFGNFHCPVPKTPNKKEKALA